MEDYHKIYENKKPTKHACLSTIISCSEKQISEDSEKLNEHKVKRKTAPSPW